MSIYNMKGMTIRFRQTPDQRCCPECGDRMIEVDRCNENRVLFVWYECCSKDCDGQWLQKTPQEFVNIDMLEAE